MAKTLGRPFVSDSWRRLFAGGETHMAPRRFARVSSASIRSLLLQVTSVIVALLLWQTAAQIPSVVAIPSPVDVVRSAFVIDKSIFAMDALLSFYRVSLGFVVAAVLGIPLGIAIGSSRPIRDLVFPAVEVLRPIPPIAWIPLAVLFFPEAEWMIIFLTFYGAFFPIVYNTISGVAGIRTDLVRAAKSLGANKWTLFWHVTLPAMLPSVFTGLHVAIGVAWLMVVAGEMIASKGGVGAMTWEAYQTTHYPLIFVGMTAIGILGFLSSAAIRALSKFVIRWDVK